MPTYRVESKVYVQTTVEADTPEKARELIQNMTLDISVTDGDRPVIHDWDLDCEYCYVTDEATGDEVSL